MPLRKSSLENNVYEEEGSPYPRSSTAKDKDRNGLDGLGSCENAQSVYDDIADLEGQALHSLNEARPFRR